MISVTKVPLPGNALKVIDIPTIEKPKPQHDDVYDTSDLGDFIDDEDADDTGVESLIDGNNLSTETEHTDIDTQSLNINNNKTIDNTGHLENLNVTDHNITRHIENLSITPRNINGHIENYHNTSDQDSDNEDVSEVVFGADNVPYLTLNDAKINHSGDVAGSGITNRATANIQASQTRSSNQLSTKPVSPLDSFFPQQPMTLDAAEFTPDHLNSEYLQIEEEGRQRRKLLLSFKEINFTIPNVSNAFGFKKKKSKTVNLNHEDNTRSVSDSVVGLYAQNNNNNNNNDNSVGQQRLISLSNPKDQQQHDMPGINSERWLKYLSYTRPTWLPPKPLNDKHKHQADADALIALAIYKDRELERKRLAKINKLAKLQKTEARRWDYALELSKKNKNSQEYVRKHNILWHGGIPIQNKFRENIWYTQIGNELNLNNQIIDDLFFGVFDSIVEGCQDQTNELIESELRKCPVQLQSISRDNLLKVVVSFLDYLRKLGVPSDKPVIEFYYNGLVHLTATFLHFYKEDCHKVFISLCNLYQRQLPSLLIQYSITKDESMKLFIENSLNEYMVNKLVKLLESKYNNQLYHHFVHVNINYINDILLSTMLGFMQHMFPMNLLVQIMDLYIYEGDTLLMFALLTVFKLNGAKFFGSSQEIINALSRECEVGYDFEFIESLRDNYVSRQS
ncbi:uncharacterized protein KQ657_002258 [Scheffersomyces spartinae]|uniref:Rab-GAP TBC domain-containing protein n=1 Tax=Scheffersomyces spartinae TaxID=45513 RepID=A0A9P8AKI9_9ASCO|nr:uncharacterized protein KQ657_002258 [Scheffersomyces spartinae]KAG7195873.1 hypothetical protein KQ657_002258 [Scheffersomyces spartinae]